MMGWGGVGGVGVGRVSGVGYGVTGWGRVYLYTITI